MVFGALLVSTAGTETGRYICCGELVRGREIGSWCVVVGKGLMRGCGMGGWCVVVG